MINIVVLRFLNVTQFYFFDNEFQVVARFDESVKNRLMTTNFKI